jgi:hypothetical protein
LVEGGVFKSFWDRQRTAWRARLETEEVVVVVEEEEEEEEEETNAFCSSSAAAPQCLIKIS